MGKRGVRAAMVAALLWWLLAGTAGAECVVVCAPDPTTSTSTSTTVAPAPAPDSGQARAQLLASVNAARAQRGLAPVVARGDVEGVASGWSDTMAAAGAISHDDAYFTPESHDRFDAVIVAENVAQAVTVEQAHAALMASEHHRDNILDARFTVIGIGASYRDGWWWITQDFVQPRSVASAPAPRSLNLERSRTIAPATSTSTSTTSLDTVQALAATVATPALVTSEPRRAIVLPRSDAPRQLIALAGDDGDDGIPRSTIAAVALIVGVLLLGRMRRPRRSTT